jgi:hypothetical protein
LVRRNEHAWETNMRIISAVALAAALSLAACAREADTRAEGDPDTSQELAEAGEAVGEAAVEVGEAARTAVTDAAQEVDENADEQPAEAEEAPLN